MKDNSKSQLLRKIIARLYRMSMEELEDWDRRMERRR